MTILRHRKQNSEFSIDIRALQKQDSAAEFSPADVSYSAVLMPFLKNLSSSKNPTKIPYPAQFYYPASSLQHQTNLQMSHIDLLLIANKQETALERFLFVVKYALSTTSLTKFPYKPFIAFVGETSHNYTIHGQQDADVTHFIGEQLARDPPTSCFHISNASRGVSHEGFMEVEPKFKTSYVRARFLGQQKATLVDPAGRWSEEYVMDVPDLMIRLMRLHTELGGTISISCPTTGFSAAITFKEKPLFGGGKNQISGSIMQGSTVLFSLDGAWDEIVYITDVRTQAKTEFFNRHTLPKQTLLRPSFSALPSTSGDKEWEGFIEALKQRDFEKALKLKEELSKADHERQAKHQQMSANGFVPQLFFKDANGAWKIKESSLRENLPSLASSAGSAMM